MCHATKMIGQEKKVGTFIIQLTALCSFGVGILSIMYRENTHTVLLCMGKEERYGRENRYGREESYGREER